MRRLSLAGLSGIAVAAGLMLPGQDLIQEDQRSRVASVLPKPMKGWKVASGNFLPEMGEGALDERLSDAIDLVVYGNGYDKLSYESWALIESYLRRIRDELAQELEGDVFEVDDNLCVLMGKQCDDEQGALSELSSDCRFANHRFLGSVMFWDETCGGTVEGCASCVEDLAEKRGVLSECRDYWMVQRDVCHRYRFAEGGNRLSNLAFDVEGMVGKQLINIYSRHVADILLALKHQDSENACGNGLLFVDSLKDMLSIADLKVVSDFLELKRVDDLVGFVTILMFELQHASCEPRSLSILSRLLVERIDAEGY